MNAKPTLKKGQLLMVTERKCSEKLQPNITPGQVYQVVDIDTMKNGKQCMICTRDTAKEKLVRINEERFSWRMVSEKEVRAKCDEMMATIKQKMADAKKEKEEADAKKFRDECKRTMINIRNKFSHADHVRISFVPLVLAEMAWIYAYKCRQFTADNKLSETKGLSRALIEVRHRYENSILRDLDQRHLDHIRQEAELFLQDDLLANTLMKAEFQLSNEYYSQYDDVPLLKLRVYGVIGMMLIRAYSRHNRKMTKLIRSRIPDKCDAEDSLDNRYIVDHLHKCLDAYLGDYELKETEGTKTIEKIIDRAVAESQFNLTSDQKYGLM